jgi:hypothetical protein
MNIFEPDYETQLMLIRGSRSAAYREISDPIFFQWQRGEKTEQEWLDAVAEINAVNPYPVVK